MHGLEAVGADCGGGSNMSLHPYRFDDAELIPQIEKLLDNGPIKVDDIVMVLPVSRDTVYRLLNKLGCVALKGTRLWARKELIGPNKKIASKRTQSEIRNLIIDKLPTSGISWKGLAELLGYPTPALVYKVVMQLEQELFLERVPVEYPARQKKHEDRRGPRVLIRRRA